MTYYVSSGTLNPTHSLTHSINCFVILFSFDSLSVFCAVAMLTLSTTKNYHNICN